MQNHTQPFQAFCLPLGTEIALMQWTSDVPSWLKSFPSEYSLQVPQPLIIDTVYRFPDNMSYIPTLCKALSDHEWQFKTKVFISETNHLILIQQSIPRCSLVSIPTSPTKRAPGEFRIMHIAPSHIWNIQSERLGILKKLPDRNFILREVGNIQASLSMYHCYRFCY